MPIGKKVAIVTQPDFKQEAEEIFGEMVALRRDFHRHPELGFEEIRTAGIVAQALREHGLQVQTGLAQTGVVGLLEGAKAGPTLMLRFEMNALPVQEENPVAYVSQNPGVMHAGGHDGHLAMGLGLAKILSRYREQMAGTLKFVFQPAEEGLGGALAMIAEGVLDAPRPDVALAMNLWTPEPYGKVRVLEGPCMASSSIFTLTVQGRGGHGAAPHLAVDPILAATHIVVALQSIVSRNADPQDSVVVSLGQFLAGTTYNVIPDKVILKGTVRSYHDELHRMIYRRILEMATMLADAFGCQASMETIALVPDVVNAPEPTAVVRAAAAQIMGQENIVEKRTMASEEMGFFLDEIPGCYFFIGAGSGEIELAYPQHHPRFDFDERAMINGVAVMGQAAANYVMNPSQEPGITSIAQDR